MDIQEFTDECMFGDSAGDVLSSHGKSLSDYTMRPITSTGNADNPIAALHAARRNLAERALSLGAVFVSSDGTALVHKFKKEETYRVAYKGTALIRNDHRGTSSG